MIDYHCELETLPDVIKVRLPDRRGGGRVRSARIWDYVPERTCHIEGPRISDKLEHDCPEFILYCGECGHGFGYIHYGENGRAWMSEPPKFCPNCGRKTAHWRERHEES